MQEKSTPISSTTNTELAQDYRETHELITYGKRDAVGKLLKICNHRLPFFEWADSIFPGNIAPIIRSVSDGKHELANQS